MTDKPIKSVAVDYQTWAVLSKWAEEEYRTVGSQVRWLVNKYGPDAERLAYKGVEPDSTTLTVEDDTILYATDFKNDPEVLGRDEWLWRPPKQGWFRHTSNTRQELLKIMMEYDGPVTNSELYTLARGYESELLKDLTLDAVMKQVSSCYSKGLIKRRRVNPGRSENHDRYEYKILEHTIQLFRNQKKALALTPPKS